jgi:hypothetical protein
MTRRATARRVAVAASAAFLAVFGGLATQLRQGHDPAVGAGQAAAPAVVAPRRVLLRRIIERRVIVRVVPAHSTAATPASPSAPVAGPPVVTSSPAPAAATAPAPAPPVTRSS